MKRTTEVFECDRCGRVVVAGDDEISSYTLVKQASQGGPVYELCKICYVSVDAHARGAGAARWNVK